MTDDISLEEPWREDDPSGRLPPALLKALEDPFSYALGLRDGRIIDFASAKMVSGGEWVHLYGVDEDEGGSTDPPIKMSSREHTFPRGIDIRLSDIIWVADAPDGS